MPSEQEIFEKALDIENLHERTRFLDEACGGDQPMRARLDAELNKVFYHPPSKEMTGTEQAYCPKCGRLVLVSIPGELCTSCRNPDPGDEGQRQLRYPTRSWHSPVEKNPAIPTPQQLAIHFPNLEIFELLGRGGMGAVYLARQKSLDRLVALKIIRPDTAGTTDFAERFSREAKSLARLNHSNIVGIYDFGSVDIPESIDNKSGTAGTPHQMFYLLMEYVDGTNLRRMIQGKSISPREALAIVPQICEALQFAHDQGIVHRDIKPENILVDRQGRVKIADFGLAKLMSLESRDFSLTGTHQVLGTPRYMAPEQLEQSRNIDHRADIYSLGVVFYELLTGELPLGAFEPPSRKVQLDIRLDEVVLRTLAKEPERRYQHASEVKTDVESIVSTAAQPRNAVPVENNHAISGEMAKSRGPWYQEAVRSPLMVFSVFAVLGVLGVFVFSPFEPTFYFVIGVMAIIVVWRLHVSDERRNRAAALPPDTLETNGSSPRVGRVATAFAILAWFSIPVIVGTLIAILAIIWGIEQPFAPLNRQTMMMLLIIFYGMPIASVITIPIVLIAASRMREFQSYGLAVVAAVLVMIPVNVMIVVGIPIGIWSLSVLMRRDVRLAFARACVPIERTREQLKVAGTWLVVAASVSIIGTTVGPLGFGLAADFTPLGRQLYDAGITSETGFAAMITAICVGLPLSACQLWGALSLYRQRSYRWSWASAIIAVINLNPGWLIGLPAGIYAMAVLKQNTDGVKHNSDLFAKAKPTR